MSSQAHVTGFSLVFVVMDVVNIIQVSVLTRAYCMRWLYKVMLQPISY